MKLRFLILFLALFCAPCAALYAEDDDDDVKKDKNRDKVKASEETAVPRSGSKHGATTAIPKTYNASSPVYTQDWPFRWEPDPTRTITRIEIKLGEQRIYFLQGNLLIGESPISTGCKGRETPSGNFKVIAKELKHYSNLYGELVNASGRVVSYSAEAGDPIPKGLRYQPSPMPFYLRLTDNGVGMHEGFLPGYAASHGCIRLPKKLAPLLFDAVTVGTPVIIYPAPPPPPPQSVATASNSGTQSHP
jgi:lipoprotein-anchoring transpeptidase ErfK/SrfK